MEIAKIKTVHRQDSSLTELFETVARQNWRQFTDTFGDSSPTQWLFAKINFHWHLSTMSKISKERRKDLLYLLLVNEFWKRESTCCFFVGFQCTLRSEMTPSPLYRLEWTNIEAELHAIKGSLQGNYKRININSRWRKVPANQNKHPIMSAKSPVTVTM